MIITLDNYTTIPERHVKEIKVGYLYRDYNDLFVVEDVNSNNEHHDPKITFKYLSSKNKDNFQIWSGNHTNGLNIESGFKCIS